MLNIAIHSYRLMPDHGNAHSPNAHQLQGWHIVLRDDREQLLGVGDALVWPQFGLTNDQVRNDLTHFEQQCLDLDVNEILGWMDSTKIASAVHYGVELACLDLMAKRSEQTLAQQLWSEVRTEVRCHKLLGSVREAATQESEIEKAIKLKVGVHELQEELDFVDALTSDQPMLAVRLDANGAWNLDEALRVCDRLSSKPNVVIEQPLDPRNLLGLDRLQQQTEIPIALDESLVFNPIGALDTSCRECVIKPMYLGGLRASQRLVERAQARQKSICVTHVLESAVGRAGAVHFAAGVDDDGPHGIGDPQVNQLNVKLSKAFGHGASR